MVATYGGCHINIGKLTHVPFAWALVLVSFFLMPPPRRDPGLTPVYIDYVWGFSDTEAQHWMPPGIWLIALMIVLPALLYMPAHFLLRRFMPKPVSAW